jgi:hypothetical protein
MMSPSERPVKPDAALSVASSGAKNVRKPSSAEDDRQLTRLYVTGLLYVPQSTAPTSAWVVASLSVYNGATVAPAPITGSSKEV